MGWLWKNDDSGYFSFSSGDVSEYRRSADGGGNENRERCATRKVVKSQCHTEEVEPGKFIRKCEKTEQIFKDCLGRPSEMVESNKEYTEEDVTDQMVKGSFPFESSGPRPSYFPGLRNDIEAIERSIFGGFNQFFEAAEEMKNEFFNSVGVPHIFDRQPPPANKRGIPTEGTPREEALPKNHSNGEVDLSGLARDV